MRARWSILVALAALLAACSSGSVEVVAPEPPPATAVPAPAPVETEPPPVVDAAPSPPVGPVAAPEASTPAGPAAAAADPVAASEDDPVLEGSGTRPATGAALPGAPAAAAPAGAVRAAAASSSGRPASTGRIEIPAIGLNHPTYEGIDLGTLQYGPGHWPGTPLPGQRGNTVFPGHRTTHSRPFWDLDKLKAGNEVIFTTPAGRFTYKVTEMLIVGSRDTWVVNGTPDATFTLLACHPKGSAKQRIVAKGKLVSAPPPPPPITRPAAPPTTRQRFLGLF